MISYSQNYAQKHNIKFGRVSMDELLMTSYENDTTAVAVILSDVGKFNSRDLRFTRHVRVKILKKSGLSWGNWTFNTPTKSTFKVVVSNLENGEIVSEKATNKSIYEEYIVDNFDVYKVFAPNVKVGSVIDISYSHFGIPFEWRFQSIIPVVYNELELENSHIVKYSKFFFGFEEIKTINDTKWIARNMPAFHIESFLSNYKNYITKFQFQLISINFHEYSTTWERIIDRLLESERFGSVINGSAFLNDIAKEINSKNLSVEDKIEEAYKIIQQNIKWNGINTIYASEFNKNNFKNIHSGNSADINLLMVTLLNKLNIRTFPVVLSTRDNGYILNPSIDRLNFVVAYVKHDNIEMLIDATSIHAWPGILPAKCLNQKGLLVNRGTELWINLNESYVNYKKQFSTITVHPDGTADGVINFNYKEYAYLNWCDEYDEFKQDDELYLDEIKNKFDQINIDDYVQLKNERNHLKSSDQFNVNLSNQLIDTGDGLIINPLVMIEYSKNPFKTDSRKYPVDLIYPTEFTSTVIVKLPDNYTPISIPESTKLSTSDGNATFTYLINASETGIQFSLKMQISKHVFDEGEYPELKQFYSEVSRLINHPIELKKL